MVVQAQGTMSSDEDLAFVIQQMTWWSGQPMLSVGSSVARVMRSTRGAERARARVMWSTRGAEGARARADMETEAASGP